MVKWRCSTRFGPGLGRPAEVARQRRRIRHIRLPAAVGAARAARTVERERQVAELTGDVVTAAQHLAVDHHADADAVRHADEHDVAGRCRRGPRATPRPAPARRRGRSFRSARAGRSPPPAPRADRRCASRASAHAARASSSARPCRAPPRRCPRRRRPPGDRPAGALTRSASCSTSVFGSRTVGKRNRAGHRRAEQIGQHHERLAGANVGRHHGAAAGIDVEEGRLAAADGFAGRAFEDQPFAQQVVDDQGDRAAAHVHGAREVGARDRLPRAHQVERDAAVDLAGGAASGDA